MPEAYVPAVSVEQLFDEMFEESQAVTTRLVAAQFPEYLPPVVLTQDEKRLLSRAFRVLQEATQCGYRMLVNALYEDQRELRSCCVVLSVQLQVSQSHERRSVEEPWFEELRGATADLVRAAMRVTILAEQNALTIDFRLPVHHADASKIHHPVTVLLVEDDDFVRHATTELLELKGYEVNAVPSAEAALNAFETQAEWVSVVISDITLPGMDGRSFSKEIHKKSAKTPVLLISGYVSQEEDQGEETVFLPKPFDAKSLIAAIGRCLERRHQAVALPMQMPECSIYNSVPC